MNVVKEIQRINQKEITNGTWSDTGSWHAEYKNSAWIFAGNMPFDLTEGDVVCIFSQYGEIIHVELIRDHKTGKSKGFAFIQYEDQRSTILAVDNLNGADVLGRTLRVDHSHRGPRKPKKDDQEESDDDEPKMNVAPQLIEVGKEKSEPKPKNVNLEDEEDPMAAYFREKKEKKSKKTSKHHKHRSSKDKVEKSEKRRSRFEDRDSKDQKDDGSFRRHRSRSPLSHSRSPTRHRSRSPLRRRRSSLDRSRSPRRRSRSPTRRRARSRSYSPSRRY